MNIGPPVDHHVSSAAAPTVAGSGRPAVLLLHGMLGDPRMWISQVRALGGVADVDAPLLPSIPSVEEMADQLLLDAPPRFFVAGFSLGGHVALAMQRRAPHRVLGMLLVSASGTSLDEQQRAATRASIVRVRAGGMSDVVLGEQVPRMLSVHTAAGARELIREMASGTTPRRFVDQLEAQVVRPGALAAAAQVDVAVEVVVGSDDTSCPPAVAGALAAAIPTARYTEVPRAGHSVVLEQPEEVTRLLEVLLQR